MKIEVNGLSIDPGIKKGIIKEVSRVLKQNKGKGNLSINLINDRRMRMLNKKYREKDKTTDVLSFEINESGMLGEIYISLPTARKQAKMYNVTLKDELERLAVHGTLHILGYTHKEMGLYAY
ncbi:MAG: rRNA maturation RNase YbeY [Candidatus Margulisiibacteriota bacterium]